MIALLLVLQLLTPRMKEQVVSWGQPMVRPPPLPPSIVITNQEDPWAYVTKFGWNKSTTPNVGYKLYFGPATRTYTNVVDAGSATNVVVESIQMRSTYFVAATAYMTNAESAFSQELVYKTPRPPTRMIISWSPTNRANVETSATPVGPWSLWKANVRPPVTNDIVGLRWFARVGTNRPIWKTE